MYREHYVEAIVLEIPEPAIEILPRWKAQWPLGWQANTSLRDGVKLTYEWFHANQSSIRRREANEANEAQISGNR